MWIQLFLYLLGLEGSHLTDLCDFFWYIFDLLKKKKKIHCGVYFHRVYGDSLIYIVYTTDVI